MKHGEISDKISDFVERIDGQSAGELPSGLSLLEMGEEDDEQLTIQEISTETVLEE